MMTKQFSFYEFTGIITPGALLMYFANYILKNKFDINLFGIENVGESVFLIIVAYAVGHIIQALGNIFEQVIWKIYGGVPTSWLTKLPSPKQKLFDDTDTQKILEKIYSKYGKIEGKDYGKNVYNLLYLMKNTGRIDIFNANYSLFRGLTVSILIITILCIISYKWYWCFIPLTATILTFNRMVRFAKLYAKEIFRTFLNTDLERASELQE